MKTIRPKFWIEARKRVPLPGGDGRNFTTVADGRLYADLVIEVDVEKLVAAIGGKALRSKSRKSQLQAGAVRVIATNVKHVKETA